MDLIYSGIDNSYIHPGLNRNTTYYYRVRAKNLDNIYTDYSTVITTKTKASLPGDITFVTVSKSSIVVSWGSNDNPDWTEYELYASTGTNTSYGLIYTGTALTYPHSGLNLNTTYYYKVRAKNLDGEYTGFTTEKSTHTLCEKPGTPTFIAVNITSITVQWNDNGNPTWTDYRLEKSIDGTIWNIIYIGKTTTYTDTPLIPNTTHHYKVAAVNLSNVKTDYTTPTVTHTLCNIPGPITFVSVTTSEITIIWGNNGNSESTIYKLEASTGTNTDYGEIYSGLNLTYTHGGLKPNTTYFYRVRAVNLSGIYTDYNVEQSTRTKLKTPGPITFTEVNIISISFSWTSGTNPPGTYYQVEESGDGINYTILITTTQLAYTHTGLIPNTTHYYRVAAKSDIELSPYNESKSTHTLCNIPGMISFVTVTDTEITVRWEPNGNSGSTIYKLEASTGTNTDYGEIYSGLNLTYTHSGLNPNTIYYYRVRAVNLSGIHTDYNVAQSTKTKMAPPGEITFQQVNISSIAISWLPGDYPSGTLYQVEHSTDDFNYKILITTTETSCSHINLNPNTLYYYRVAVKADAELSIYSGPKSTYTLCNLPRIADFTDVSTTTITANWTANNNPPWTVYYCEVSSITPFNPLANSGWITQLNWTATGLHPNTRYYFRVKAKNNNDIETAWVVLGSTYTKQIYILRYSIDGYVKDPFGNPIKNVTIKLRKLPHETILGQLITDNNGYYKFTDLEKGNYRIVPIKQGWNFISKDIMLESNITLDFIGTSNEVVIIPDLPGQAEIKLPPPQDTKILFFSPNSLSPYINPNLNEEVYIIFQGNSSGKFTLRVFTLMGELVDEITKDNSSPTGYFKWIPQDIGSGTYLLHIEGLGVNKFKKIAILR